MEQGGIFANAANINRAGGPVPEKGLVAIAAVAHDMQRAGGGHLLAQGFQLAAGHRDQIGLLGGFDIGGVSGFIGTFAGFGRCGRVAKSNRHQARRSVRAQRAGGGKLEPALRPGELDLKGRPQRIAPPRRAVNPAACLAQEGIIHGDHQGRGGGQARFDVLAGGGEEGLGLDAILAVEAVVGGPIVVLAILGGEQASDGVATQGNQLRQGMGGVAGRLGGGGQRMIQKGVQVLEEGSFFLSGTGSGGTTCRESTRWPLSTRVHSSCSPFWKARA